MTHTVTVHTERGKHDSLQKPVKIAFTLTPVTSDPSAYKPVAYKILKFGGNNEERKSFTWDSGLGFCTYARKMNGKIYLNDKTTASFLSPGQAVSISAPRKSKCIEWNLRRPQSNDTSITAVNETGSAQHVMLHIPGPDTNKPCPIVVYRPFDHGQRIVASSTLALQAYVVSEAVVQEKVLRVKDRRHPIWFSPIKCDFIPSCSNWRLSQGRNGEIQIKNTQPELDLDPTTTNVDDLSRNAIAMREQLISMQASIDATKPRLETTKEVAKRNEVDISDLQTSVNATCDRLPELDRQLPIVEAKVAKLQASFGHVKDRLDVADETLSRAEESIAYEEQSLAATDDWVVRVDAIIDGNRASLLSAENSLAILGDQLTALDHRVVVLQAKEDGLAALCDQTLEEISAAQKPISLIKTRLTRLRHIVSVVKEEADRRVIPSALCRAERHFGGTYHPSTTRLDRPPSPSERASYFGDSTIPQAWARLDPKGQCDIGSSGAESTIREVVYSVVRLGKSLVSRPEAPGPIWPSEDKLAALTVCVSDMERRILTLKTSIADIENSFRSVEKTVTKNQAAILALQTSLEDTRDRVSALDRQLADVEAKATRLDVDFEDTKERIVVTVGTIEDAQAKIDTANQSLDTMCDKLSVMGKDAVQAQEDAKVIDERSRSTQKEMDRLSLRVDAVVGGAEVLEQSVAQARRSLDEVEHSLDISRRLAEELDSRIKFVEAKVASVVKVKTKA